MKFWLFIFVGFALPALAITEEREVLLREASDLDLPKRETVEDVYERDMESLSRENEGNPTLDQIKSLLAQMRESRVERDNGFKAEKPRLETLSWNLQTKFAHFSESDCTPGDTDLTSIGGDRIKMLNFALVFNGPGKGSASFGHTMQRFDYCRNGKLKTLLMTEGPTSVEKLESQIRLQFQLPPEMTLPAPSNKKGMLGILFIWFVPDLAELYYERLENENRDLTEAHMDMNQRDMYKALLINMKRFGSQLTDYQAGKGLTTYNPFKRTCLKGYMDTMRLIYPGFSEIGSMFLPRQLFNYVAEHGAKRIVHYPKRSSLAPQFFLQALH